ncbi:MAG: hypothetical protein PWP34_1412 [Desulfuromonadales bacterium]|jgi:hypothetical protein|nr:hypothetical protein [Desulfuromonadales bacterium]
MNDTQNEEKRYFDTCKNEFWQEVFALELDYLTKHLEGCRDILSVGCGPAFLEAELAKRSLLSVRGEFFLCIENDKISPCTDRADAALYILLGTKGI